MDFEFIYTSIPKYADAALLTLYLAFIGIFLSLIIGTFCALSIYFKITFLNVLSKTYIEISRNTPLLIQLIFLHFGLKIEAHMSAMIGLAFLGGSYMAEAFRSGLEAVEKIQIESGLSIGLTKIQLIKYIIFPQAMIVSMPALGANLIFLLKETSIISVIALADLVYVAKEIMGLYYMTNEALFMLVISYLIILLPISTIIYILEKKVRYAVFGN